MSKQSEDGGRWVSAVFVTVVVLEVLVGLFS
jgi:hypothetical protein